MIFSRITFTNPDKSLFLLKISFHSFLALIWAPISEEVNLVQQRDGGEEKRERL